MRTAEEVEAGMRAWLKRTNRMRDVRQMFDGDWVRLPTAAELIGASPTAMRRIQDARVEPLLFRRIGAGRGNWYVLLPTLAAYRVAQDAADALAPLTPARRAAMAQALDTAKANKP